MRKEPKRGSDLDKFVYTIKDSQVYWQINYGNNTGCLVKARGKTLRL